MLLRLLGLVSVGTDELSLVPVSGTVLPAVLAHLALAEGRHLDVDTLIDRVWDRPPDSARNSLQVAVSKLRRQVGSELFESGRGRYRFRTELVRVDWLEAEQLVAQARSSLERGSSSAARAASAEALARFTGVPVTGLESVASAAARERMAGARREATTICATALLDLGQAPEAVGLLRTEVEQDPRSEPAHVLLMRALTADGRPAEALALYDAFRHRLAEELGTDPTPATVAVFTAILDGTLRPEPDVVRTGPVHRADHGRRLPQPATPLLGREHDLEVVERLLSTGHRLLTLLGHGGIGKTHLAIAAARAMAEKDGRDAFFVDLSSCASPPEVTAAITSATDTHGEQLADVADALTGRPTIVVLDNAEQVADAVAEACQTLLANPETGVIVTSRVRLRLRQERVIDVGPLSSGDADSPAVTLLRSRTDGASARALVRLAQRTGGIPLLLELVVSALRWRDAEDLAAQLDDSLTGLQDDARDRPARQADLGTVIEWSLGHVPPPGRTGLYHLTAVHGPFEGPLATALLRAGEPATSPQSTLAELVDVGLVQRVIRPGELRFRILEPIRDYVASRAAGALPEAVLNAHAHHFLARLTAADACTPDTQLPMTELVHDEEPNLVAALDWTLVHEPDLAIGSMGALLFHWSSLGRWDTVAEWCRRASDRTSGTPEARARVRLCELSALLGAGRTSASELHERSEPLRELVGSFEPHWYHRWIRFGAELAFLDGDLDAALRWTNRYRPSGQLSRYSAISHRGNVLSALGAWQESLDALLPLLDEPDLHGNPLQHASVLNNVGFTASQLHDYELADRVLTEAIELSRTNGQTELSLIILVNHAWVTLKGGDPRGALAELVGTLAEFPDTAQQVVDMAEVAAIGALALRDLGRRDDAALVAAYARAAVAADPARFDPHMHEQTAMLEGLLGSADVSGAGIGVAVDGAPEHAAAPAGAPNAETVVRVLCSASALQTPGAHRE